MLLLSFTSNGFCYSMSPGGREVGLSQANRSTEGGPMAKKSKKDKKKDKKSKKK